MVRRAYAYTETYSRTTYSDGPVKYYVLQFALLSAISDGISAVTTMNPKEFQEVITEQSARGTNIVTSRLPFGLRSIDAVVISEDSPIRAKVRRVPLDKAA